MKAHAAIAMCAAMSMSFATTGSTSAAKMSANDDDGEKQGDSVMLDLPAMSVSTSNATSTSTSTSTSTTTSTSTSTSTSTTNATTTSNPTTTSTSNATSNANALAEAVSWMHVDPNLGPSPWAGETVLDRPEVFARVSQMMLRPISEASAGGMALSTHGYGSDAPGLDVNVHVATIGHGSAETGDASLGPSAVGGEGNGHAHHGTGISMREVGVDVGRGLPRATVQGVVHQSLARMSACYSSQLSQTPDLAGRVVVKFTIGADGTVAVAQDAGSDLPNDAVVKCVVRNFEMLVFPQPDDGNVTVVYPLVFAPTKE